MKTTVNRYDFERAFADADRKENFSYEALGLLFEYFEECDPDMELDVIAICCEYSEDTWGSIAENYSVDLDETENDDEQKQQVRDFLEVETIVIGETATGFVYAAF